MLSQIDRVGEIYVMPERRKRSTGNQFGIEMARVMLKLDPDKNGIPKSKITFFQQRNSLPYFTQVKSNQADIARARAQRLLGVRPTS